MDRRLTRRISDIRKGFRHRRDLGDIDELAASIAELGLLHPIVIRSDGRLIAGERRLAACKRLGWKKVPVTVIDLAEIVRGEFAENAFRKGFLPSEIDAIRRALEPIEKAAAKERQKATRFGNGGGGKFPPPARGKTRDKVGAFAGISGRTLDKIAAVVDAAKANTRFAPLVRRMDQTGHVHSAFKQLQAMRSNLSKESLPSVGRSTRLSVTACNKAFPKYPATIEDKGWVYSTWYCGTSWHKTQLHGQFPPTFLKRALALFPHAKRILHCPSGTVLGPGLTIDLVRDDVRVPQIVANAAALPLASGSMDLVLSDPPYTNGDSEIYGCAAFPMRQFMKEARRVLRRGGHLGMLHTYYPSYRQKDWKLVGLIGVVTGAGRVVRLFSIFQRL
jgi:hypothetical protein